MTESKKPITSDAEKFRKTTRDGRTYAWGDESFYSVTSQLSALGKPWLGAWAAKMVAEYAPALSVNSAIRTSSPNQAST